jgi:hypothetical protein
VSALQLGEVHVLPSRNCTCMREAAGIADALDGRRNDQHEGAVAFDILFITLAMHQDRLHRALIRLAFSRTRPVLEG